MLQSQPHEADAPAVVERRWLMPRAENCCCQRDIQLPVVSVFVEQEGRSRAGGCEQRGRGHTFA